MFEPSDVEQLDRLYLDPDVMRYIPTGKSGPCSEKHIELFDEQFSKTGFTLWAVEQKSDAAFVGRVGLWPLDGTSEVELGYLIAKPFWGRGFATEASAACLDFGFYELALDSVAAIADPENRASLRVMEKLGFEYVREDRFYDMNVRYHRIRSSKWNSPEPGPRPGLRRMR